MIIVISLNKFYPKTFDRPTIYTSTNQSLPAKSAGTTLRLAGTKGRS
jgi:hypothetical protein